MFTGMFHLNARQARSLRLRDRQLRLPLAQNGLKKQGYRYLLDRLPLSGR